MDNKLAEPCNDVLSDNFVSKMDVYFTSSYVPKGRFGRLDQDLARSALATTRPIKDETPKPE